VVFTLSKIVESCPMYPSGVPTRSASTGRVTESRPPVF
jgi:hypothetical protein